jgi:hypothetical protein
MKIMLAGVLAAFMSFGFHAQARDVNSLLSEVTQVLNNEFRAQQFDFKKGDFAKYDMSVGGFIKGKMEMNVLDVSSEGVWLQQLVDLGFAGKQDVRQLMDPNTGEIKKHIVNGKEQAPPERGDIEIIDQKQDTVQVPAGRFTCVYIKANVQAEGQKAVVEQWLNPREVAVVGLVKMATQTQLGPMTAVLTSFKKN